MRHDYHQSFLEFFPPERDKSLISTRMYIETFSEAAAALRRPASSTAHSGRQAPREDGVPERFLHSLRIRTRQRGSADTACHWFDAQLWVQRQHLPPNRCASFKTLRPSQSHLVCPLFLRGPEKRLRQRGEAG